LLCREQIHRRARAQRRVVPVDGAGLEVALGVAPQTDISIRQLKDGSNRRHVRSRLHLSRLRRAFGYAERSPCPSMSSR
jgi:hypothetical protein